MVFRFWPSGVDSPRGLRPAYREHVLAELAAERLGRAGLGFHSGLEEFFEVEVLVGEVSAFETSASMASWETPQRGAGQEPFHRGADGIAVGGSDVGHRWFSASWVSRIRCSRWSSWRSRSCRIGGARGAATTAAAASSRWWWRMSWTSRSVRAMLRH